NLGCLYARVAGRSEPRNGLPTNVVLYPRAVDRSTRELTKAFSAFDATGPLSAADAPYDPSQNGLESDGMRLLITQDRLDDRRRLLAALDRHSRMLESVDRIREQAYRLVSGGLAEAFNLEREDPRLVARYDTAPLVHPDSISQKWSNHWRYV